MLAMDVNDNAHCLDNALPARFSRASSLLQGIEDEFERATHRARSMPQPFIFRTVDLDGQTLRTAVRP
ncbi:hypothetical protein DOZ80_15595, partial [Pseudomonas fluorescens]